MKRESQIKRSKGKTSDCRYHWNTNPTFLFVVVENVFGNAHVQLEGVELRLHGRCMPKDVDESFGVFAS